MLRKLQKFGKYDFIKAVHISIKKENYNIHVYKYNNKPYYSSNMYQECSGHSDRPNSTTLQTNKPKVDGDLY